MKKESGISRRGFLKTAAAVGTALTIQPAINKEKTANSVLNREAVSLIKQKDMQYRTLVQELQLSMYPPSVSV